MADPLSISASIAGLIALADSVFRGTFKYLKNVKDAPKEISKLSSELGLLYGVLNSLRLVADQLGDERFDSTIRLHHIHSCLQTLEKVKAILNKHDTTSLSDHAAQAMKRRMRWPFSISEAKDLIMEIERHKSTLSLALTADGMQSLLKALSRQGDILDGVKEIQVELRQRREAETRVVIGEERRKILNAVGPIDPYPNHEMSLKLRHPATGLWLTESDEFKHWLKTPNARL